jgi:hypothetical protein
MPTPAFSPGQFTPSLTDGNDLTGAAASKGLSQQAVIGSRRRDPASLNVKSNREPAFGAASAAEPTAASRRDKPDPAFNAARYQFPSQIR